MKKSLLALAVLSAFAGAASAQSSVTLSGSVDLGVRRSNEAWSMTNAGSSRTNISLSGTEDLGGGMNAFFYMNHRFNANTGAQRDANAFWRQAWVGIGGGFGKVRLGKMLPPLQEFNGDFDPFGTDTVGSVHTGGLFSGQSTSGSRYNNAIYYTSPSLGGLSLHAMIAAGDNNSEISAVSGNKRPTGLGVNYGAGPFRVAAAYDRNADDKKTKGVYGSFNAGFATFMAQWEKGDIYSLAIPDVARWSLGAKVPFGAAALKVGYTKWSDENVKKFGIGLDYSVSKRTTLYTDVGKLSGNGKVGTPAGALSDKNRKAQFDIGINHKF
jgi:predicted porin